VFSEAKILEIEGLSSIGGVSQFKHTKTTEIVVKYEKNNNKKRKDKFKKIIKNQMAKK